MTELPDGHPPRTVLVVDDESTIRRALVRFFSRRGWRVEEAEDGVRARERLLAGDADQDIGAILCDLRMPGLTGVQLYELLLVERPILASRVIFSSGDTATGDMAMFAERTGRPVLQKPYELAGLADLVERVRVSGPKNETPPS